MLQNTVLSVLSAQLALAVRVIRRQKYARSVKRLDFIIVPNQVRIWFNLSVLIFAFIVKSYLKNIPIRCNSCAF